MEGISDITADQPKIYDILGCGFGPSNLAIAIAIVDKWSDEKPNLNSKSNSAASFHNVIFIEKHPTFLWHPGMLLSGSRMQISCLKDLVTLRRPTSPFTFLSYLHSQNRLVTFINRSSMIPTRREFADYLSWAALETEKCGIAVAYSEEVVSLSEVQVTSTQLPTTLIEVVSRHIEDNTYVKRYAKHIILGAGGSPHLPRPLSSLTRSHQYLKPLIVHSSVYADSVGDLLTKKLNTKAPIKIAIIGSGQSAAEILIDLRSHLESLSPEGDGLEECHKLDLIIREGSLKPSDASPFVNRVFDPESTDMIYTLSSPRARKILLNEYKNTNYGVVNPKTLESLYEIIYDQKLESDIATRTYQRRPRFPWINIRANQNIISASEKKNSFRTKIDLEMENRLDQNLTTETYDAIFCATGYDRSFWLHMLQKSNLAKRFGIGLTANTSERHTVFELVTDSQNSGSTNNFNLEMLLVNNSNSIEPDIGRSRSLSRTDTTDTDSTSNTTPLTSSGSFNDHTIPSANTQIRISRRYRLLPVESTAIGNETFDSRIYLQGYAEATHGLSDTLLSVVGVRAGEVVDDLWEAARPPSCQNASGEDELKP